MVMRNWIAVLSLAAILGGAASYWLSFRERAGGRRQVEPSSAMLPGAAVSADGPKVSRLPTEALKSKGIRADRMRLDAVLAADPRRIALSVEELAWMERHYYPRDADVAGLDDIDVDALSGTMDAKESTLQGLALMRRGREAVAISVLDRAAALGSIYAYEEAAVAEHRELRRQMGETQDGDDILRARLEVAKVLGDYRVDQLIESYLPGYPMRVRAEIVQRHTTEFLGKLGQNAKLMGVPAPGPDPRPNLEQWRQLQNERDVDGSRTVEIFRLQ